MKYLLIGAIIFLIYRFYNPQKKITKGSDEFPKQTPKQELELDDFTDYEELE